MSKRVGSRLDRGFRLSSLTKVPSRAEGIYPRKGSGLGEYGSVAFPTVLEAYNHDSDFKRWKLGQDYYFGTGRSWGDLQIHSIARFNPGAVSGQSKDIVTLFPSKSSPEKAWFTGMRTRGSIMFPAALNSSHITLLTTDPDPANHRLVYDVSTILTPIQVAIFSVFLGDQFEDTASGTTYPDDLISKPAGSVALTLVDTSTGGMTLTFDLSRPQGRIERNGRIYWKELEYDPSSPTVWDTSSGRYLCSAFKMFCCCPDHLGGSMANMEQVGGTAGMDEFPLPNANRTVAAAWEKQGAGYYRQWRTLPIRHDERRECKHIHALRWQCGIPWYEPDDYPTSADGTTFSIGSVSEQGFTTEDFIEYFRKRRMSHDRYLLALADVVGINIFPGDDPRNAVRFDQRPIFWNDGTEPLDIWCRQNDWWLKRGSQSLRIFNSSVGKFESTVSVGGIDYPMVETVEPGSPGAPVIVP